MQSRKLLAKVVLVLFILNCFFYPNITASAATDPEVTVTVNEELLNAFLDSMFTNLKSPSMPLVLTASDKERTAAESYGCISEVTLKKEEAGVTTAIKFEQGKLTAPMAFSGAYNSTLLGCVRFSGWANTNWGLEFDSQRQALLARVQVQEIHLTRVPALAGASLSKLVQSAIDQRINPLELVRLEQLSASVPIPQAGGALKLRAKSIRPEILPGNLQLHVIYEVVADR
ncbi:MAG TPA: hypothetical protein VGN86_02795 [Pyrinomonadaceae bacterium]|nr:hypothetical protein [Pyrinomonadaceae bacterium]